LVTSSRALFTGRLVHEPLARKVDGCTSEFIPYDSFALPRTTWDIQDFHEAKIMPNEIKGAKPN
jgi:hypothetical protein